MDIPLDICSCSYVDLLLLMKPLFDVALVIKRKTGEPENWLYKDMKTVENKSWEIDWLVLTNKKRTVYIPNEWVMDIQIEEHKNEDKKA